MPRHWLTVAVLIVMVIAAIALLDSPPQVLQPDSIVREDQIQLTDYFTGVESTHYNERGTIEYNFTAQRVSHFQPDPTATSPDDYTNIKQPFFTFFQAGASPWFLRAEQARSTAEGEEIALRDQVRAWQDNPGAEPTVLNTSELLIRPETRIAETDQFVKITYPGAVTTGVGMWADLNQEAFAIHSEGKTIYEPSP